MLNFLLFLGVCCMAIAQDSTVKGTIIEEGRLTKIVDALVAIEGTAFVEYTDAEGQFTFSGKMPKDEYVVSVYKKGYQERFFLINVIQGEKLVVRDVKLKMIKKDKERGTKLKKRSQKDRKKKRRKPRVGICLPH